MLDSPASPDSLRAPVPPPVLFFVTLGSGVLAARVRPFGFLPAGIEVRLGVGLPVFGIALAIGVWAFSTFRRFGTSAQFGEPVSTLVQVGPYRYSRNPLYVALLLVLLGFAVILDTGWLAIGVPLLWLLLDRLVVAREEPFLARLFGAEYAAYGSRVRRWL
jgi:protein-S-isoprenylcysteine O-methyltransferase Ste14